MYPISQLMFHFDGSVLLAAWIAEGTKEWPCEAFEGLKVEVDS